MINKKNAVDYVSMILDGWKVFDAEPPDPNSFKWILAVLKGPYVDPLLMTKENCSVIQAGWVPDSGHKIGKVISYNKINGSVHPIHQEDVTDRVVLWKKIEDALRIKGEKHAYP